MSMMQFFNTRTTEIQSERPSFSLDAVWHTSLLIRAMCRSQPSLKEGRHSSFLSTKDGIMVQEIHLPSHHIQHPIFGMKSGCVRLFSNYFSTFCIISHLLARPEVVELLVLVNSSSPDITNWMQHDVWLQIRSNVEQVKTI